MIVVTWNRATLLRQCLESILAQETNLTFEVIVVDNGSDDGTVEMLERDFGEIRVIRNRENRGFCAANNQGIGAARGALLALLNNDAEANPCWINEMHRIFQEQPDIGMAACKIVDWANPQVIDKAGHLIFLDGQNRGRGMGEIDRGQYDHAGEVLWPDGCACMYRKTMIDRIGGFDEDFFAYGDDAELGLRARIAGWKAAYVPAAVVRHRRGSTLGRGNPERVRLIERNRILLVAKLFPWGLLLLNPIFFALRVAAGLVVTSGGGDLAAFPGIAGKRAVAKALLRGQWDALKLLPRMLRKRGDVNRIAVLDEAARTRLILSHQTDWHGLFGMSREVTP